MKKYKSFVLVLILPFLGCNKDTIEKETMYFPAKNGLKWETKTIASLKWNEGAVADLKNYLIQSNTKSFMILHNGRIVMEEYFDGHTQSTPWAWNSAGKTLVTATTGIAQQEGLININKKASQYLGVGWTSAGLAKENLITPRHLLTMTSGLSDESNLVLKSNLTYLADAGTRWSYHNVFQKLMDVVEKASNQKFETYFETKLRNKIGMDGFWDNGLIFRIYNSNTRSMARFGILALNKGKWQNEQIIYEAFFNESTTTSQDINPSYGYLWWLNGKSKYMLPGSQKVTQSVLVPNAPSDMFAAMGAADQRLYIVPSKDLVIVRMGETSSPGNSSFALTGFDNELWAKLSALIK
jgi:CubicO group peptidase (beta-lactamase class C family)